jgi:hypothetical protein
MEQRALARSMKELPIPRGAERWKELPGPSEFISEQCASSVGASQSSYRIHTSSSGLSNQRSDWAMARYPQMRGYLCEAEVTTWVPLHCGKFF